LPSGLVVFLVAPLAPAGTKDAKSLSSPTSIPRTHFLIIGKPQVADPIELQPRGAVAIQKVADAAGKSPPGAIVDALPKGAMTIEQYRRGASQRNGRSVATAPVIASRANIDDVGRSGSPPAVVAAG
jgi:hypothetical protein